MELNIVEQVKNEVLRRINDFKKTEDYDFWNEHVRLVFEHALKLAKTYKADKEIVGLGALLHDIALIDKVGTRKDHNINGTKITVEILKNFNYEQSKIKQVESCVLHHRSSKNAENINELCVADADILAHFSNIPMICEGAYGRAKLSVAKGRIDLLDYFYDDFNDLSKKTQKKYKPQFEKIMDVLFPERLKLVIPTNEYKLKLEQYKKDILTSKVVHGTGDLEKCTVDEWIKQCLDNMQGKNLPSGYVPATTFIAIREMDNEIVGTIQIRHRLNDKLLQHGGHIGYMIRPSEQQKGYAKEMLRLALKECKKLDIENVLITCKNWNIGSAKTIIANGGKIENEIEHENEIMQRYWITIKGKHKKKPPEN